MFRALKNPGNSVADKRRQNFCKRLYAAAHNFVKFAGLAVASLAASEF